MFEPIKVYPSHAIKMRAGLACGVESTGITLNRRTREKSGLELYDYVCIASPDQDTLIYRQIKPLCCRGITGLNYAYIDGDSLHLLNVDLHAVLLVWKVDYDMDMP